MKKVSLVIVLVLFIISCNSHFENEKVSLKKDIAVIKKEKAKEVQGDIRSLMLKSSSPITRLAMNDEREL